MMLHYERTLMKTEDSLHLKSFLHNASNNQQKYEMGSSKQNEMTILRLRKMQF
jgi:hypothetical protein